MCKMVNGHLESVLSEWITLHCIQHVCSNSHGEEYNAWNVNYAQIKGGNVVFCVISATTLILALLVWDDKTSHCAPPYNYICKSATILYIFIGSFLLPLCGCWHCLLSYLPVSHETCMLLFNHFAVHINLHKRYVECLAAILTTASRCSMHVISVHWAWEKVIV